MLREMALASHLAYTLQLLLGLVFACSCLMKLRRPRAFVRTVADYRILPRSAHLEIPAAILILVVEAGLALAFLAGFAVDVALGAAALVVIVFGVGVSINLARGRTVVCGCFGSSAEFISRQTLVRLGLLLGVVVVLAGLTEFAAVHQVTIDESLEQPGYFVDVIAVVALLGLLATWILNWAVVGGALRALRNEASV